MRKRFISLEPGQVVSCGGKAFQITHILAADAVLAINLETRSTARLKVDEISPREHQNDQGPDQPREVIKRDLSEISDTDWAKAEQRLEVIRPLLDIQSPTTDMAQQVADETGVGIATVYRWRRTYLQSGSLSALVPISRGRKKGVQLLTEELEAIVNNAIEEIYLTKDRNPIKKVIQDINAQCRTANIDPPHANTIRRRIQSLSDALVLRRRGYRDLARDSYEPNRGQFPGGDTPMEVVQIDHTQADLILVEETTRLPIGRPWVTLAIDIFSRMVVGFYVSFEHPSAVAVGMCLSMGMLPKAGYLVELDVPGEWPVWGKMGTVHADNAKEFRGAMLQKACHDYGIDLQLRPVKVPHYGGHIERLMGTFSEEIKTLPGKTFSSPNKRKGYDSEKNAALTLREFETRLVDFIVNVYHQRKHSGLGMSPLAQYNLGIAGDELRPGAGLPILPADPKKLTLDFMPFFERGIHPYGIVLDTVHYYSEVLNPWINAKDTDNRKQKRKFIVRRDPRDISVIHFFDPETKDYYDIPYRNLGLPPMSLWELREVKKELRRQGQSQINEEVIFEAHERMGTRLDESLAKTKKARRKHVRKPSANQGGSRGPLASTQLPSSPSPQADDPFADPVEAFDDLSVSY